MSPGEAFFIAAGRAACLASIPAVPAGAVVMRSSLETAIVIPVVGDVSFLQGRYELSLVWASPEGADAGGIFRRGTGHGGAARESCHGSGGAARALGSGGNHRIRTG